MAPPDVVFHIEWREHFRSKRAWVESRRYVKPARAATQLSSILSAPDDVVELVGIWESDGWKDARIHWRRLDPEAFCAEHLPDEPPETDGLDDGPLPPAEKAARVVQAWHDHQERTR